MRVCIIPRWDKPDKADGGIRRVVEAQQRYLPQFGVEVVAHPDEADVLASHGSMYFNRPSDKPVVHHGHGAYWSVHDWPAWAHHTNMLVVEAMARAQFHTAPSHWVANALTYGMMVYPEVIHHGIDSDKWEPSEHQDFVLWNKARSDAVSDPADLVELARHLPDVRFVSTIGKGPNIDEIGVMPVGEMREFVRHAGLYLATARETFGIGTLEAMSCAVPIVGWDWGGQSEIVKHGETGFLAKPGDYKALAEGIRWAMAHRDVLGGNARQDVLDRWGWEPRIKQYADLYRRAKEWWDEQEVKVSVVVTTHNLARFLGDCLESVAAQEGDWECIVVDDASEDYPERLVPDDDRFRYSRSGHNLKLPEARNRGFELAKGRYILFLDADDMLAEDAIKTLSEQLDLDPSIHIVYGHLDTVSEDGSNRQRNSWPFKEFSWRGQMAHLNQLPYSAMMRREVLERIGGYRRRHWRNEDAPLWILASSYGFRIKKVTEAATLIYRWRSDSKTQQELKETPEGDWTSWFPWRMGAENGPDGAKLMRSLSGIPNWQIVPWSAQEKPPSQVRFWPVPDHTEPRVSIIIPVGPNHDKYVIDALESVRSQTFQDWECIVVNVTGKEWEAGFRNPLQGCPWARVIDAGEVLRPSAARNLGIRYARADALLILDADDILLPHALEEMYSWYVGTGGGLIYTDWLKAEPDPLEPMQLVKTHQFHCGSVLRKMQHSMMCLIPKVKHDEIGGYDEAMPGWEDWDYLIGLQAAGLCSYRVPMPCFVYRFRTGTIREDSFSKKDQTLKMIREKWADYYEGRKHMPCGSCPGGKKAAINPGANPSMSNAKLEKSPSQMVLLSYQGPDPGKHLMRGPVTNAMYIFHANQPKYVMPEDAPVFLGRRRNGKPDFIKIERPSEKPRVSIPVAFEAERPAEPDFPEMPDTQVGDMTLKQLEAAVVDASPSAVLQWLQQEREGKNRKGAIRLLEDATAREPA